MNLFMFIYKHNKGMNYGMFNLCMYVFKNRLLGFINNNKRGKYENI